MTTLLRDKMTSGILRSAAVETYPNRPDLRVVQVFHSVGHVWGYDLVAAPHAALESLPIDDSEAHCDVVFYFTGDSETVDVKGKERKIHVANIVEGRTSFHRGPAPLE